MLCHSALRVTFCTEENCCLGVWDTSRHAEEELFEIAQDLFRGETKRGKRE